MIKGLMLLLLAALLFQACADTTAATEAAIRSSTRPTPVRFAGAPSRIIILPAALIEPSVPGTIKPVAGRASEMFFTRAAERN